ncbi:MAG TPA: TolC family protein [Gemmatimonadaceae bacterium]|nr:TolC family protein [Gemmatimonadaceae bacterium]
MIRWFVIAAFAPIGALAAQQPTAPMRAPVDSGVLVVTRAQAIALALARNPQIQVAREQVAQARARVTQATAIPDPSLSATAVGQNGPFSPHAAEEHDVALGVTIPFPDRLRLAGHVAEADVRTAELSYDQLRQLIASQTSQTYDSLLVALRHQSDFEQARALARDFLTRTEARYQAGTSAKLDVIKARVDLAQAENQLIAGERDIANASAALNRLVGRVLGAPVRAADSLAVPDSIPDVQRLEARAAELRPELKSLAAQRAGARAATSLAREYWLPDISLSVSHNRVAGENATYDTGIGIAFPLFFWQHRGGEVAEARHHELELAASGRDLSAQVSQEVRVAWASASTALRQALYLRDQLLPEAQQAYHIASVSYGLGGSSALEVLDAKRTLLDAQSQYTDALGAVNDAVSQLELAVGAPLDSTASGARHD